MNEFSVSPEALPSHEEAMAVANQIWDKVYKPRHSYQMAQVPEQPNYGANDAAYETWHKSFWSKLHADFWRNSTNRTGVRSIRIRIFAGTQQDVTDVMQHPLTKALLSKLPTKCWKVYSYAEAVVDAPIVHLKGNVLKIYYRSNPKKPSIVYDRNGVQIQKGQQVHGSAQDYDGEIRTCDGTVRYFSRKYVYVANDVVGVQYFAPNEVTVQP